MKRIGSHIMASGLFLCSLFGLWIIGIMPAISLIIGAISLLGFAAAIGYIQTPVVRKGAYWFYGVMVVFIAVNMGYSLIPTQIREELQANKKVETIKMAEQLHPSGSGTVEIIRDICKEEYEKNLKGIVERYQSSTDANRSEQMIEQMQKLETARKKCGNAVINGVDANVWFPILGIVFLSIFIAGVVFKIHILWKVSFAAGIVLFVVWVVYGQGSFLLSSFSQQESTATMTEEQLTSLHIKEMRKYLVRSYWREMISSSVADVYWWREAHLEWNYSGDGLEFFSDGRIRFKHVGSAESRYELISPDSLRIWDWNGKQVDYRIVPIDNENMQLTEVGVRHHYRRK